MYRIFTEAIFGSELKVIFIYEILLINDVIHFKNVQFKHLKLTILVTGLAC